MNWSVEDFYKEFTVFKMIAKIWLQTKGVPDHKQYLFILQLLGKEVLHCWEFFPFQPLTVTARNNQTVFGRYLKDHSSRHQAFAATGNKL